MKVRINEPGWETFSEMLCGVKFENAVSVRELTPREIAMIGSNLKIVRLDNDEQVGASVVMANTGHLQAKVETPLLRKDEKKEEEVKEVEGEHTQESLEALAEKGGIKAVRVVADTFGVKGVQISGLIEEILKAQSEAK